MPHGLQPGLLLRAILRSRSESMVADTGALSLHLRPLAFASSKMKPSSHCFVAIVSAVSLALLADGQKVGFDGYGTCTVGNRSQNGTVESPSIVAQSLVNMVRNDNGICNRNQFRQNDWTCNISSKLQHNHGHVQKSSSWHNEHTVKDH